MCLFLCCLLPPAQCAANSPEGLVSDIELYLQCIFTQLDLLNTWVIEQQELHEQRAVESQQKAASSAGEAVEDGSNGACRFPGAL